MNRKTPAFLFTYVLSLALLAQEVQLVVPLGHTRRVVDMAVAPDGRWLASFDGSDQVKIWDYETGGEMYQLRHTGAVSAVAWHPSGNWLAAADEAGKIRIWDALFTEKAALEAPAPVTNLLFFPDGRLIGLTNAGDITVWDIAIEKVLQSAQFKDFFPVSADLDANGMLALGSADGYLMRWNATTMQEVQRIKVSEARVGTVAMHAAGILAGSDLGELILWNGTTVNKVSALSLRNYRLAVSGNTVVVCGRDADQPIRSFSLPDLKAQKLPFQLEVDKSSEAFQFGLRAMRAVGDTSLLLADYQQRLVEWKLGRNEWSARVFRGLAAPIYDLAIHKNRKELAIASGHNEVKVLDLTATRPHRFFPAGSGVRSVDFHPSNPVLATYTTDQRIRVTNLLNAQGMFELKAKGDYNDTPVRFDPTGRYVIRKSSEREFDFYDFKTNSPKTIKVTDGLHYAFSPDGRTLYFQTKSGLTLYDPIRLSEIKTIPLNGIQSFSVNASGQLVLLMTDDVTVQVLQPDGTRLRSMQLPDAAACDRIYASPGNVLVGVKTSVKRNERPDFGIRLFDASSGALLRTLPGHSGFVTSAHFYGQYLFTTALDGLIKIWDLSSKDEALRGTLIPLENSEFVVTTPSGLFDATPTAMKQLHYVKSGKIIALDQLKSEYYEPNLLSKLLGLNEEPLKAVNHLNNINLYPEVKVQHPLKNDGKLGIDLADNGGGIGRIVILINGKEVFNDVRSAGVTTQSSLEIDYNITNHPYLYQDKVNKVSIKAYNQDGTLSSREQNIYLFGDADESEKPRLFAVVAGTSDYAGTSLDLKYAAKDASDFANALTLSASQLVGKENTHVTLLTTELAPAQWPTKANIQAAFEKYSREATAQDILVVYLAGHGVNQSGEHADFYYLTPAAESGDLNNTVLRQQAAISSAELTEYIKSVAALKQIMVIDACHSGKLASALASSRSAVSSTQVRALERMKDRTGLFVLAGSAADAVSYETTLYGQGLLTYSLLFGMKGAALRDNEFVDVVQLFQYAANRVPELAEDIGGVQKPEIRLPEEAKSFDMGRLTPADRDKIELAAPKPVYVHARFQDESSIYDRLHLGDLLDHKLLEISKMKDARLVFVDDKSFGGAFVIHGRYTEADGLLKAKITLTKNQQVVKASEIEAVNADLLADAIVREIVNTVENGKTEN